MPAKPGSRHMPEHVCVHDCASRLVRWPLHRRRRGRWQPGLAV